MTHVPFYSIPSNYPAHPGDADTKVLHLPYRMYNDTTTAGTRRSQRVKSQTPEPSPLMTSVCV